MMPCRSGQPLHRLDPIHSVKSVDSGLGHVISVFYSLTGTSQAWSEFRGRASRHSRTKEIVKKAAGGYTRALLRAAETFGVTSDLNFVGISVSAAFHPVPSSRLVHVVPPFFSRRSHVTKSQYMETLLA